MTREQRIEVISNSIERNEDTIYKLKEENKTLKEEAIKLALFKEGDKVMSVTTENWSFPRGEKAFVSAVVFKETVGKAQGYDIQYKLNKIKKDGTMSKMGASYQPISESILKLIE